MPWLFGYWRMRDPDPEKTLALADAAEHAYASAHTEAELASASLDAYRGQLDRIAADRERQEKKLRLCDPTEDQEIALLQAKISKLDDDLDSIKSEATRTVPALRRASQRAELLDGVRQGVFAFMPAGETMNALGLAAMLGYTPEDLRLAYDVKRRLENLPSLPPKEATAYMVDEFKADELTLFSRLPQSCSTISRIMRRSAISGVLCSGIST